MDRQPQPTWRSAVVVVVVVSAEVVAVRVVFFKVRLTLLLRVRMTSILEQEGEVEVVGGVLRRERTESTRLLEVLLLRREAVVVALVETTRTQQTGKTAGLVVERDA